MDNTNPNLININDFKKIEVRAGTIISCEKVTGSDKLLKLLVDMGEIGTMNVLSGISQWYECSELIGLQCLFVTNLQPRSMMGMISEGMLMAIGADLNQKPVLLRPLQKVKNGDLIR